MTYQEAIERIKIHNEHHSQQERFAIYITEALNMAIEALEKQMPEAPILDIIYPSGIKSYNCPVCGKGCLVRTDSYCPKYCSNCGQALDWSGTE